MRTSVKVSAVSALMAIGSTLARAESIVFVGNSFTYGALSPVWRYRAASVTDLNGDGVGGVPALFLLFTEEAGLSYQVSLETSGGKDLQWHIDHESQVLDRRWDHVVLQSVSTLDGERPGDPASLVRTTAVLAALFHGRNPRVDIWLDATWSRPDLTYRPTGHWYGKPITAMALDVRAGCDQAAKHSAYVHGVLPVGQAFSRAIQIGFATADPEDGQSSGRVDLWAVDDHHASTYGYYLEALVEFGAITGKDPSSLGAGEIAARELGIAQDQATVLQRVAHDELRANRLR